MGFSTDFIWGAASAAAQIEGAWDEDGRTPSVWDLMPEGKIHRNETCHQACDHYHRWREDVAIMKKLGLQAYRFSISWSRVIPQQGVVNAAGIQFYSNLVDALREAGIEPMITLFHSDMPQWIFEMGGWENPQVVEEFAFFAKTMITELSDRVSYWFTLNEPQCFFNDYLELDSARNVNHDTAGEQKQISQEEMMNRVYRGVLLSHGRAVQEMRKAAKQTLQIGMVIMGMVAEPVENVLDETQAEAMTFADMAGFMGMVRWTDPMILGKVPSSMSQVLSQEDLAVIHQPLDLFCCNVYSTANYCEGPGRINPLAYPGMAKSHIGMPFRPKALYYMTKFAYRRYHLPVLFTENGFSNLDFVMMDGKVHDPQRIDYIHQYLLGLKEAIEEGYPVAGYLYWSIMDNFEWTKGYDLRFGLVYVDYRDQKRTIKDSGYYYSKIIESNGDIL